MKLLLETWREHTKEDPAEGVIDALVELGGEEDGVVVIGDGVREIGYLVLIQLHLPKQLIISQETAVG